MKKYEAILRERGKQRECRVEESVWRVQEIECRVK